MVQSKGGFPTARTASNAYDKAERAVAAKLGRPAVVNHPRPRSGELLARKGGHEIKPRQSVTTVKDAHGFVEPPWGKEKRARCVGVYWHTKTGMWQAHFYTQGVTIHGGRFNDPEEAAKAYDAQARAHAAKTGEMPRVNFPVIGTAEKRVQKKQKHAAPRKPAARVPGIAYKYVSFNTRCGRWQVIVQSRGIPFCCELFDDQVEAARRADAVIRENGLDMALNFATNPGEVQAEPGRVQRQAASSSGYLGVSGHAFTARYADGLPRWDARIYMGKCQIRLGTFTTEEAAARAYDAALRVQRRKTLRKLLARCSTSDGKVIIDARFWEVNFPQWPGEVPARPESRALPRLPGSPPPRLPELSEEKLSAVVEGLHACCHEQKLPCDTLTVLAVRALRRSLVDTADSDVGALVNEALQETLTSSRLQFATFQKETGKVVASVCLDHGALQLRQDPVSRAPECDAVMLDVDPCDNGSELELHSCKPGELPAIIGNYCNSLCYHDHGVDFGVVTVPRLKKGSRGKAPEGHILAYVHMRDAAGASVVRFIDLQTDTKVRAASKLQCPACVHSNCPTPNARCFYTTHRAQEERICDTLLPLLAGDKLFQKDVVFWCPAALVPAAATAAAEAVAAGESAAEPRATRSSSVADQGAAEQPAKRRRKA